jgi:probable rRNA maturation factor
VSVDLISGATHKNIDIEVEDPAWSEAAGDLIGLTRAAAAAALATRSSGAGAVTILLTDDATVRDLNARFRGQDKPTNVLSFPASAPAGTGASARGAPLGDIALAFGVCALEAAEQGKPLIDHLRHLTVHGVLHLLGYDHGAEDEAERMENLERKILAGLGVADPYA